MMEYASNPTLSNEGLSLSVEHAAATFQFLLTRQKTRTVRVDCGLAHLSPAFQRLPPLTTSSSPSHLTRDNSISSNGHDGSSGGAADLGIACKVSEALRTIAWSAGGGKRGHTHLYLVCFYSLKHRLGALKKVSMTSFI